VPNDAGQHAYYGRMADCRYDFGNPDYR